MQIPAELNKWIVSAILRHVEFHNATGAPMIVDGMSRPETIERWIEVRFDGPNSTEDPSGTELDVWLQANILCCINSANTLNPYDMGLFAGIFVNILSLPIRVPEIGKCLSLQTVRNRYRGPVSTSVRTFATSVEAVYSFTFNQGDLT